MTLKKPKYIVDEKHFYLGKEYILRVIDTKGKSYVFVKEAGFIELFISKQNNKKKREDVIYSWYRQEMQKILPVIFAKWEKKIKVKPNKISIRKMKTRWGSCNFRSKKIWLNLELIKKPLICVEYVVVHELVHFLEPSHNKRFKELMSSFMPEWKQHKQLLNKNIS